MERDGATYDLTVGASGAADNKVVITSGLTWTVGQRITAESLFVNASTGSYVFRGALTLSDPVYDPLNNPVNLPELPRQVPNFDAIAASPDWATAPTYTAGVGESLASAVAGAAALVWANPLVAAPKVKLKLRHASTYSVTGVEFPNFAAIGSWVKVTTDGTKPADDVIMDPDLAAFHQLPKILGTDPFNNVISFAAGANGWMFEALEVTAEPEESNYPLIYTGRFSITALSELPYRLSFRQCYIHGNDAHYSRIRGIEMNASIVEVTKCWISKINYGGVSYSPQCQSISCNSSFGRHRVEHNFLWHCVETIAYGGAGQFAQIAAEQLMMSDVYIGRNYVYMPKILKGQEGSANFFEFKNCRRVIIEKNICRYRPNNLQNGYTTVTWSVNQNGGSNEAWIQTSDFTIRYNWFEDTNSGFSISGTYGVPKPLAPCRFHIHNNVYTGLDTPITFSSEGQSFGWAFLISPEVTDVLFEYNTVIGGAVAIGLDNTNAGGAKYTRLVIRYNALSGYYFIMNDGIAMGQAAWDGATDASCGFYGNVCCETQGTFQVPNPGTNTVVASIAAMGFVDPLIFSRNDVKLSELGGCAILGANASKGADITTLRSYLADVEVDLDMIDVLYNGGIPTGTTGETPVLTELLLSPTNVTVAQGDTQPITVTALDQFGNPFALPALTLNSDNPAIASLSGVSSPLILSGLTPGSVGVSVTGGGLTSNSVSVTVTGVSQILTTLTLAPTTAELTPGGTATFTVVAKDQTNTVMAVSGLSVTTTLPGVATGAIVGGDLVVTAVAAGSAQLRVVKGGVQSNAVTITVAVTPSVLTSLVIAPSALYFDKGSYGVAQLGAFDQNGLPMAIPTLQPHTSNSAIAAISSIVGGQILITGIGKGNAQIWVSSGSLVSNRIKAQVSDPANGKPRNRR